eukprot:1157809-Pelagomonas_calceolata.AAC.13
MPSGFRVSKNLTLPHLTSSPAPSLWASWHWMPGVRSEPSGAMAKNMLRCIGLQAAQKAGPSQKAPSMRKGLVQKRLPFVEQVK